jgi:hypothetical protein
MGPSGQEPMTSGGGDGTSETAAARLLTATHVAASRMRRSGEPGRRLQDVHVEPPILQAAIQVPAGHLPSLGISPGKVAEGYP